MHFAKSNVQCRFYSLLGNGEEGNMHLFDSIDSLEHDSDITSFGWHFLI